MVSVGISKLGSASGISSMSILGWRSTAAIIKLSPSIGWSTFGTQCSFVDEIKLNYRGLAWRILPFNMFVLPYQVVYNVSKMSLSELLWYNQFEPFQPPHHTRIRPEGGGGSSEPNEPPWIRHCDWREVLTSFVRMCDITVLGETWLDVLNKDLGRTVY